MYTSLVERTPGAGRHANFSAGVASANAINCRDTCLHSPSYPCQIPSGAVWANTGAPNKAHSRNALVHAVFMTLLPLMLFLVCATPYCVLARVHYRLDRIRLSRISNRRALV